MGQLLYQTYNETDYDYMSKLYDYHGQGGAGFHKINSTQYAHPQSRSWGFSLQNLYRRKGEKKKNHAFIHLLLCFVFVLVFAGGWGD